MLDRPNLIQPRALRYPEVHSISTATAVPRLWPENSAYLCPWVLPTGRPNPKAAQHLGPLPPCVYHDPELHQIKVRLHQDQLGSPKIWGQSAKARLVVISSEVFS